MAAKNVVIVGAGLFGSIAATLARANGHKVTVIDNSMRLAASLASGCVMAPSWFSSLSKEQVAVGMATLEALYPVEQLQFKTLGVNVFKASRVYPGDVLLRPDVGDSVDAVGDGWVQCGGRKYHGKVLVAAGIWSDKLVKMPPIRALYGASMRVKGMQLPGPLVKVYAPYRQAVAINLTKDTVWFGDGTALIRKTWEAEAVKRQLDTVSRFLMVTGRKRMPPDYKMYVGARPYVEGHKDGYFERVFANTWVSSGGAKNGTILAAWQAHRFVKECL